MAAQTRAEEEAAQMAAKKNAAEEAQAKKDYNEKHKVLLGILKEIQSLTEPLYETDDEKVDSNMIGGLKKRHDELYRLLERATGIYRILANDYKKERELANEMKIIEASKQHMEALHTKQRKLGEKLEQMDRVDMERFNRLVHSASENRYKDVKDAPDAKSAAEASHANAKKAAELAQKIIRRYGGDIWGLEGRVKESTRNAEAASAAATEMAQKEEAVKKKAAEAERAEKAENATLALLTQMEALLDTAKKARKADDAEKAVKQAEEYRDRITAYTEKFTTNKLISKALDEANRLVADADDIAERAQKEQEEATGIAAQAIAEVAKKLGKYKDRSSDEQLVRIADEQRILPVLERNKPISRRIAEETEAKVKEILETKRKEAISKIREQEEKDKETDLEEIGDNENTGLMFIISRTRHAISGAQKYKNDTKHYIPWVEAYITKTQKMGPVGDLCGSIENVGAFLYRKNEFVGVAVPVVLEEKHTTINRTLVNEEHDNYALITASELQTASVLGYYKSYNTKTKQSSRTAEQDLSVTFLSQMFVDGICNVEFEKAQEAMANFKACLAVILNGEMSGLITEREVSGVDQMIVEKTYYSSGNLATVTTGLSALTKEQKWVEAIYEYKNRMDEGKPQFIRGSYVTPIGGYSNNSFQFALLVHIRENDAIVAVASTDDANRALVVKKTDVKVASGVLDFALDISKGVNTYDRANHAKKAILKVCGHTEPRAHIEGKTVGIKDRYLAVSYFRYYDSTIVPYYKRDRNASLFYNTLWLLGIAHALKKNEGAVDFLVTPDAYNDEANSKEAESLIDAISEVDKELKKLAFEGLYRTDEEGVGEIADLVATDYAGCTWLDTKRLRDALYGRYTGTGDDAGLVTKCNILSDTRSNFQVRGKAEKLSDLAAWIQTSGYLFDTSTDYVNGVAAIAHFVYIARDLLIKPVADLGLVTKKEGAQEEASRSILLISAYLAYIKHRVKVYHTVVGMQMRCVRYIAHIVKTEHGTSETRAHLHHRDLKIKAIMRCNITTSLPWVAAEYTAMQDEASEITDLVFERANFHHLARLYNPNDPYKDNPAISPVQNFLISANQFHLKYLNQTVNKILETKADIEKCNDPNHVYKKNREVLLSAFQTKLQHYKDEQEKMKGIEVEGEEKSALSHIQSNYSLAVLNAVSALLKAGEVTKKVNYWVFGCGTGTRETGFWRNTRFCWSDSNETPGYSENHKEILQPFGALMEIPPKLAYDHIDANMDYLYNATRDCTAKKSTRGADSDLRLLELTVNYPEPTIGQDIPSLVEWVDKMNETAHECDYSERGIEYIILRHIMPLSAQGPTDNSIRKLGSVLERLADTKKESNETSDMYLAKKVLIGDMCVLIDGTVPQTNLKEIGFKRDYLTLNLLLSAYMTIASHKGKLADVLESQSNQVLSLRTHPTSSWSLTKLDLDSNKENEFVANKEGHKFVVGVEGDGVAKVHRSLMSARCKFDHWKVGEEESVISTSDTRVRRKNQTITLEINRANETEEKADVAKGETRRVFTGNCEWWGYLMYGSAVIPIGGAKVTELVVIPGEYDESKKSSRFLMGPGVVDSEQSKATVRAYLGTLPTKSFVVTLDSAGLLPVASTETDELVRLFVAYAYAGSKLGTRLMQCVASRAIYDPRRVPVPGYADAMVHDAIRRTIHGSSCPFGWYSACALLFNTERHDFPRLQCTEKEIADVLVGRLVSSAVHESDDPKRRAAFSFWAEYGEPERLAAYAIALEKESDKTKKRELQLLKTHTDEWMTTLSATTGRFVREDQREKIGQIVKIPWSVVQMNMGFGKSSVIVPMLVARYLCRSDIRIVFVTQPPHLVPQAARTVGALIAAHPYVRGIDGSVVAVRALNGSDMTKLMNRWNTNVQFYLRQEHDKYVVVLSTAELQCIVRDYPGIYGASGSIVHIADEVDAESDPLKCEVIIEGPTKQSHYNKRVADNPDNIQTYYEAACDLVFAAKESYASIEALNAICETGELKAGTRLRNVYESIKANMKYRVNFGMSDDPDKIAAVPYDYSGTPSRIRDFSDIDVAILVLVMSIDLGMRDSDKERLRVHISSTYGDNAESIMTRFSEDEVLMKRFYLMHMALSRIKMSTKENAVSFVDLLGMAGTLVGFSGTMGASIEAPEFSGDDKRRQFSEYEVPTIDDDASNKRVRSLITGAKFIFVHGDHGLDRAREVIKQIASDVNKDQNQVCIVDGSGEFGVFPDDVNELRETWNDIEYFDAATGMRKRNKEEGKRTVLYYSHRNSRGTDSEMSETAIGRTIMSWETSRESDIAQAIFRLRKLDKAQKVVLVVVSKSELADENKTGKAVLERLGQNERAYAESASDAKAAQMAHAAKSKRVKADFDRDVVYKDVASVGAQKQQEQQAQNQALVQNEKQKTKALARKKELACYEKTRTFTEEEQRSAYYSDGKHTLLNLFTETKIRDSLIKTKIGLSPMITDRDLLAGDGGIRRAFALEKRENSQRGSNGWDDTVITVTVITIVEAWGRYKRHNADMRAYYTHDGHFIHGNEELKKDRDIEGAVLLGRYLCDEVLSISEEVLLLEYLKKIYRDQKETDGLRAVLQCFYNSGFITAAKSMLLGDLAIKGNTAASIIQSTKSNVDGLIDKAANKDKVLRNLLEPIIRKALGIDNGGLKTSFGKRKRRSISSFV